jgi:hypothetical protein
LFFTSKHCPVGRSPVKVDNWPGNDGAPARKTPTKKSPNKALFWKHLFFCYFALLHSFSLRSGLQKGISTFNQYLPLTISINNVFDKKRV